MHIYVLTLACLDTYATGDEGEVIWEEVLYFGTAAGAEAMAASRQGNIAPENAWHTSCDGVSSYDDEAGKFYCAHIKRVELLP